MTRVRARAYATPLGKHLGRHETWYPQGASVLAGGRLLLWLRRESEALAERGLGRTIPETQASHGRDSVAFPRRPPVPLAETVAFCGAFTVASHAPLGVWLLRLADGIIQTQEGDGVQDHTELLTALDVGHLVGLGPDAVREAIKRGDLPFAARTPRGTYLVTRDAAEAFRLARERRKPARRALS
jgi:hypothetical protein